MKQLANQRSDWSRALYNVLYFAKFLYVSCDMYRLLVGIEIIIIGGIIPKFHNVLQISLPPIITGQKWFNTTDVPVIFSFQMKPRLYM